MSRKYQLYAFFLVGFLVGFVFVMMAQINSASYADSPGLPPRPTMPPPPTAVPPKPNPDPTAEPGAVGPGARLQLHLTLGKDWPWNEVDWQGLWTVVQWYNRTDEQWYDVDGWRGTPDMLNMTGPEPMAVKEWWVSIESLNRGPFRWLIYDHEGGALLATSESFRLPEKSGDMLFVGQSIAPNAK